jgi:hypothetical protein
LSADLGLGGREERERDREMAAAVRRAVQYQGVQLHSSHSAMSVARPGGCVTSSDLMAAEVRQRLPVALSSVVPQDWLWLQQDRRGAPEAYPCGLTATATTSYSKSWWNYATVRGYYMRNISKLVATANGKRAFLVDTLALVLHLYMSGPSLIIKIMDVIGSLMCLECLD